jgi:hypothetical protein
VGRVLGTPSWALSAMEGDICSSFRNEALHRKAEANTFGHVSKRKEKKS